MEIFTFMEILTTMSIIQDTKYTGKVTKTEWRLCQNTLYLHNKMANY